MEGADREGSAQPTLVLFVWGIRPPPPPCSGGPGITCLVLRGITYYVKCDEVCGTILSSIHPP